MAQVTISVDAGITVEVVQPPVADPQIAVLQAQVAELSRKITAAKAYLQSAETADAADDAARTAALAQLG